MKTFLTIASAVLAALVAVVALVLAVFTFWPRGGVKSHDFDSFTWKHSPPANGSETRLFMADDLLDQRSLVGRSRPQVIELLGEPDRTPYFKSYDMVYFLGRERRAFGLDSEWLVLRLSHGTVVEARIVTD